VGAWWFGAPPAPESDDAGSAGGGPHAQLCCKHDAPPAHTPQSTETPQAVPAPHAQSTPHFGTWQHVPPLTQMSLPQPQSTAQEPQFSPAKLAQIPSPQTGMHKPLWHVVPDAQDPHDPPHPSGPHEAPLQEGVQHAGGEPGLHT
jgi:hypothetical protein